ncbi:hypothetical protein EVAR_37808_1 [Eumeta japonica]|uniref:Uncharacterized protein n=1 Tax=Eumeta variegata TaxID=151549 RepID=A0A4C1W9U9_EUMVA|nr:hypothetical protein EVAR_37808_1 [Eumeta japonica]
MTVGGRVATTGSGGTALDLLSCGAFTRIPERPHHVQIIENILGFLGPGKDGELAIMVSRLCGKVCTPSAQEALAAEVGLDFIYREVGRNAADNGFSLRSSSRAYV